MEVNEHTRCCYNSEYEKNTTKREEKRFSPTGVPVCGEKLISEKINKKSSSHLVWRKISYYLCFHLKTFDEIPKDRGGERLAGMDNSTLFNAYKFVLHRTMDFSIL